jgi:hypothetical protein
MLSKTTYEDLTLVVRLDTDRPGGCRPDGPQIK